MDLAPPEPGAFPDLAEPTTADGNGRRGHRRPAGGVDRHARRPGPDPGGPGGGTPGGSGSGRDGAPGGAEPGRPVRPAGPSTRFALIAFGLALLVFTIGLIADGLSSSTAKPPSASVRTAAGSPLRAAVAGPSLRPITVAGQPPSDIVGALAVPVGTTPVPSSAKNQGLSSYDRSIELTVAASQSDVITFYRKQLAAQGWSQISSGPPSGASHAPTGSIEVLGRHASEDGNYWEVGAVVYPTRFTGGAASSGSAAGSGPGRTPFTLRLFVVEDQQ